jgi:hypothetical protein
MILSISCGGKQEEGGETTQTEETPPGGAEVYKPTGDEGTITGKVAFQGEAPKLKPIDMGADPVCASKHSGPVPSEVVTVNSNRTLKDVFVYVKGGLGDKTFAVPEVAKEFDQVGCMYVPHVFGIQARQKLNILTKDNTTHNIHPQPQINPEWNESQPPGSGALTKTFNRPEVLIPVKCNQHPWMLAYIGVLAHPFYAVTGDDGTFTIKGLPPGEYEIEAYHGKYRALPTQKVTVGAKETKTVDFTYNAAQAYNAGSLEVLPAMVLPCCGEH